MNKWVISANDAEMWWAGFGFTPHYGIAAIFESPEAAAQEISKFNLRKVGVEPWRETPPDHVAAMEAQTGEGYDDVAPGRLVPEPSATPPPDIPRRSYLPGNTPAEIAIRRAMLAVEEMPAHPLLTDAVNLLQQAREKVADFVDGPASAPAPAILAAPPRDHITRKRLEEMVQDAFRFDDVHLTAYRIAYHVVKQLGIEIVEEG